MEIDDENNDLLLEETEQRSSDEETKKDIEEDENEDCSIEEENSEENNSVDHSLPKEQNEEMITGYSRADLKAESESLDQEEGDDTSENFDDNNIELVHSEEEHSVREPVEQSENDENNLSDHESEISLVLLKEVKNLTIVPESPLVLLQPPRKLLLSAEQRDIIAVFASMLRQEGIEILKLNRRNKWQMKVLTVSDEAIFLKTHLGDLNCPEALLWVKRFNPKTSYSLTSIRNEGRGGVQFSGIQKMLILPNNDDSTPPHHSISLYPKFKDSVSVQIIYLCNGNSKIMTIRCKTKEDAEILISSTRTVIDAIKNGERKVTF